MTTGGQVESRGKQTIQILWTAYYENLINSFGYAEEAYQYEDSRK